MSKTIDLSEEFVERANNGEVGDRLVSETNRVRVWHIHAKPGDRLKAHTHVLDYFWTVHTAGLARNHKSDGTYIDVEYLPGDTNHLTFAKGERMTHSLENIGMTDLIFTTVEFLDSENPPLLLNTDEN